MKDGDAGARSRATAPSKLILIGMLLLSMAATSACTGTAGNSPVNPLPNAKQPTIPGQRPPEAAEAPPFSLPTKGYPWSVTFRQNEVDSRSDSARTAIAKYDVALLSRTPGLAGDIEYLASQSLGSARIIRFTPDARPRGDRRVFAGHWLLFNGATLTSDTAAVDGLAILSVDDAGVFAAPGREFSGDDVMIYGLGEDGRPDWTQYEEAIVVRVDQRQKLVTVRRAQYGTRPREFEAGKAVVAAHVMRSRDDSLWVLNLSTSSPVSPQGARGPEATARLLLEEYRQIAANTTGILLDQAPFDVYLTGSTARRAPDIDNTMKPDWGMGSAQPVGTVNSWGLGMCDLVRYLREGGKGFQGLGKNKGIWVGSSSDRLSRAVPFANGFVFDDFDVQARPGYSVAYENLQYVSTMAGAAPRLSFTLVKSPTLAFSRPSDSAAPARPAPALSNSPYRLGLGTALLQGGASAYTSSAPGNRASLGLDKDYYLDEYGLGKENRPHYLGTAIGPAVSLSGTIGKDDLLKGEARADTGFTVARGTDASITAASGMRDKSEVVAFSTTGKATMETRAAADLKATTGYSVTFWARANNRYGEISESHVAIPTTIHVALVGIRSPDQPLYIGTEWTKHSLTFYTEKATVARARVSIRTDDPGTLQLSDLELHEGTNDIRYRLFDNGLVVVNGTDKPVVIDMDQMVPGVKFKAIDGNQDRVVNDGKPTGQSVTVPAYDSRIFVK